MYVCNDETESLYLKKRQNTVKAAIQEGADIIPTFFFGNSRLFKIVGSGTNGGVGTESFLAKFSRKFRTSIMLFYGRHGLPVPVRQHLHMATGNIIPVKQNDNPSDEEVNRVMEEVIAGVKMLYNTKKPEWEQRPLVIA